MSVAHFRAALSSSPYLGVRKFIHVIVADFADSTGHCWAKQETIAERVGCSVRYVRTTIQQMIKDGLLEVVASEQRHGKGSGRWLEYRLRDAPYLNSVPVQPEHSSDPNRNTVPLEPEHSSGPIGTPGTPGEHQEQPRVPAARMKEETVAYGQMPEDQPVGFDDPPIGEHPNPRRRKVPGIEPPDTFKGVQRAFYNGTVKAGHRDFNRGALRSCLADLKVWGLTYEEMTVLVNTFFTQEDAKLRATSDDPAIWFRNRLSGLMKDTARTRTASHSAAMAQSDRLQASALEQMRQLNRMREQTA